MSQDTDDADEMDDVGDVVVDATDPPAQIQAVLAQVERTIGLLEPVQDPLRDYYDRLRQKRDQLEEAFTVAQAARLKAGGLDFKADVDRLQAVVKDLESATRRTARAKEIIGYVTMAVDVVAGVIAKIIPFL